MIHKHVFMTVYPSHAAVYIHSISQGTENLNIMYVNIASIEHTHTEREESQRREKPTTLLCTVDKC